MRLKTIEPEWRVQLRQKIGEAINKGCKSAELRTGDFLEILDALECYEEVIKMGLKGLPCTFTQEEKG